MSSLDLVKAATPVKEENTKETTIITPGNSFLQIDISPLVVEPPPERKEKDKKGIKNLLKGIFTSKFTQNQTQSQNPIPKSELRSSAPNSPKIRKPRLRRHKSE